MEAVSTEALKQLYRSRFRAFLKVAAGVAGERLAPDAVHEGFVRALRHRSGLRDGRSLEAWVWRTVINAAHDVRAAHREELGFDRGHEPAGNGHPASADESLRAVIAALPPRQRLAVFLRYYADLDDARTYRPIEWRTVGENPRTTVTTLRDVRAAARDRREPGAAQPDRTAP